MVADETISVFRENTSLGSIDVIIVAVLKGGGGGGRERRRRAKLLLTRYKNVCMLQSEWLMIHQVQVQKDK